MKYITQSWSKENDGILYFVQRLQEMLFHYSDDIVKAPVHNSATLIMEYLSVDADNSIQKHHLNHIAEELSNSLEKDCIMKEYFGADNVRRIISEMKKDQRNVVRYLRNAIPFHEYHKKTCQYLLDRIVNPKEKDEIEYALRTWIASVIYRGYRQEYVYRYLHTVFSDTQVDNPFESAKNFVESFDFKRREYAVYLIFYSAVSPYKELLKQRLKVNFEDDGNFDKIKNPKFKNKSFVGKLVVNEVDPYNAIESAYKKLDIFFSFYRVISNRSTQLIGKNALVMCETEEMRLPVIADGYKVIEVEPRANLESTIDDLVIGCQMKQKETYLHLRKMIRLHNMALIQPDLSDGFVNLWSILEVASRDATSDSKIEKVVYSILPVLQNDYLTKIFSTIADDLTSNLSKKDLEELLSAVQEGEGDKINKVIAFVLLPQYEQLREDYFAKLSGYPIIRQKIYRLYLLKDKKNELVKNSEAYVKRIEWHLYRLYRVRNAIVHAGDTDRNIRVLGEHLHIYCDGVITEIIVKLATKGTITTVKDVLIDTRMLLDKKKEYFSAGGAFLKEDISYLTENYYFSWHV